MRSLVVSVWPLPDPLRVLSPLVKNPCFVGTHVTLYVTAVSFYSYRVVAIGYDEANSPNTSYTETSDSANSTFFCHSFVRL